MCILERLGSPLEYRYSNLLEPSVPASRKSTTALATSARTHAKLHGLNPGGSVDVVSLVWRQLHHLPPTPVQRALLLPWFSRAGSSHRPAVVGGPYSLRQLAAERRTE